MYIREDEMISPPNQFNANPLDTLEDVNSLDIGVIKTYYTTNILVNASEFTKTMFLEGDHIRIITKICYPSIEEYDEDIGKYRIFYKDTIGKSILEVIEATGYKSQILYEDII